jgi:hypothetical protein
MTQSELYTYARRLVNATTTDWPESDLVVDLNDAQSDIWVRIKNARGVLEYDDRLYTDLPVSTFSITASTSAYKITQDQNSNEIITIHKVQIQDTSGRYVDVPRKEVEEGEQDGLLDVAGNIAEMPAFYYEVGYTVVFSPIPSRNTTAKVWYDRAPKYLVAGGTTTVPGIPVLYHKLLSEKAALTYAISKGMNSAPNILSLVRIGEERLINYETNRRKDEPKRLTASVENTR